jgi:hypothetical protein
MALMITVDQWEVLHAEMVNAGKKTVPTILKGTDVMNR